MILIADGGSTKCDWILLDTTGKEVLRTQTKGLNPTVLNPEEVRSRIDENSELLDKREKVTILDFYGAGCGTDKPVEKLREVLTDVFSTATISIGEDLMAAVYAVTTSPAIVCILGTGSNSCYYDGSEIHSPIPSLGYMIMDEASGNYLGKQLIRDYYYGIMPKKLSDQFGKKYQLEADEIKRHLYRRSNPNMYLASFAEFIFTEDDQDAYFQKMLTAALQSFIEVRILCFEEAPQLPVHFVGSIAYFSENFIRERMAANNLTMGNVIRRPIDGLIEYYRKNKIAQ